MRAIVIGAGIGGLTAALSLQTAGIEAIVVDTVERPRPLGVGINLQPHAVRELTELGLGEKLHELGIPTVEVVHFDRFGSRIWSEPRGHGLGYRWPQYSLHRGELQMLLLDAVRDRLGPSALHLGTRLERFDEIHDRVIAQVTHQRSGKAGSVEGDVLIGADGIHSTVRAQLHPDEPPLHFDGIHMWRGAIHGSPFLSGRSMAIVGSNSVAKFVAYPISKAAEAQGGALINWVAEVRLPRGSETQQPDWTRAGRGVEVLPYFADWNFDWLDIAELIRNTHQVLEYPMVDRDPLTTWGRSRVNLLGDAAHPMYPIGSNGASQAIVDARVIAFELATGADPVGGLEAYERQRRDITNALVLANRAMPAEQVLTAVAKRAPQGFSRIEDVLTFDEIASLQSAYRQTTSVDAHTLNTRRSWTPPVRHL